MIYRDELFISVTGIFLLTIFTSVNLILLISQNKHLIQSLLDGSDTAGILTSDHNITVNIIKDEKIVEKKDLRLPKQVVNVIRCKNPGIPLSETGRAMKNMPSSTSSWPMPTTTAFRRKMSSSTPW